MSMPHACACRVCGRPMKSRMAVDLQRRGRDTTLECLTIRLVEAIRKLSERMPDEKITYFEGSPTKDSNCYERWVELNNSIAEVKKLLAHRKASETDGEGKHGD